jgi:hypothetical protein
MALWPTSIAKLSTHRRRGDDNRLLETKNDDKTIDILSHESGVEMHSFLVSSESEAINKGLETGDL